MNDELTTPLWLLSPLAVLGGGLIDQALLTQFQELLNAAAALVLFEVGRKMDLAWLLRSRRQGGSLLLATLAPTWP